MYRRGVQVVGRDHTAVGEVLLTLVPGTAILRVVVVQDDFVRSIPESKFHELSARAAHVARAMGLKVTHIESGTLLRGTDLGPNIVIKSATAEIFTRPLIFPRALPLQDVPPLFLEDITMFGGKKSCDLLPSEKVCPTCNVVIGRTNKQCWCPESFGEGTGDWLLRFPVKIKTGERARLKPLSTAARKRAGL